MQSMVTRWDNIEIRLTANTAEQQNKNTASLNVLSIPKRSPDLNVLDYCIWNAVETRLRTQERKFPSTKSETRADFGKRLDKTAAGLEPALINNAIKKTKHRCELLYKAKGGLFEEGGRKRKRRAL